MGGKDVELERKGRKEERRWDGKRAASERLSIYPCQKVERKIFLLSSYSRENCSRKAPNPRVLSTLVILFSSFARPSKKNDSTHHSNLGPNPSRPPTPMLLLLLHRPLLHLPTQLLIPPPNDLPLHRRNPLGSQQPHSNECDSEIEQAENSIGPYCPPAVFLGEVFELLGEGGVGRGRGGGGGGGVVVFFFSFFRFLWFLCWIF